MNTKITRSTNPFVLIFIILLGVAIGWFYYAQASSGTAELPLLAAAQDPSFLKFKNLQFDFSLFQDQGFANLRTYGNVTPSVGTTGKQDLFGSF